jgi:hypothetical protein
MLFKTFHNKVKKGGIIRMRKKTGKSFSTAPVVLVAVSVFIFLFLSGKMAPSAPGQSQENQEFQVAPPPFSEDIFPCSECHSEMEVNSQRRELDFHEDIIFRHDEENRWCLDCHDARDRDRLHLADGRLLDFNRSYLLCGQCHGPKYRDWRNGVHGLRTGEWNGEKRYLLCAHCHDPHSPGFKKIAPEPPPMR